MMPAAAVRVRPFLILLYAQDHRGLGHINRTLTIARHLLAARHDAVAYIVTRSPINSGFVLPERCDYIKLPGRLSPPMAPTGHEEDDRHFLRTRRHMLRDAAEGLAPDLVIVDHEPLGAHGEFREGLYALKEERPDTRFVFGLRDIMDDADRIRTQWRESGAYAAFTNLYDGIAVYGSQRLLDVAEAYDIPEAVRPKLHYCGYLLRERPAADPAAVRRQHGLPEDGPLVVAMVGGGSDGYPVLRAAQEAIGRLQAAGACRARPAGILVTGPFMPADRKAALRSGATPTCRVLESADGFQLMSAADAVVSMGGYNSVCEALACGRPLVIVPRSTHKREQEIRARLLAGHGLARWIHPAELSPEGLADAIAWGLDCDRRAQADRVRGVIPAFDGAARLTRYVSRWMNGA